MYINISFFGRKKGHSPPPHPKKTRTLTARRRAVGRPAVSGVHDPLLFQRMQWITGSLALTALLVCAVFSFKKAPAACRAEDLIPPAAAAAAEQAAVSEKTVYLTFDDGPSQNTERILDTLKEAGVPATFFVVSAENNEEFLPLLERTLAEGHCIGLHSCTHDYRKIYANADAFWADIGTLQEKLRPYCGEASYPVLRFPGGSSNTVSHKYGGSGLMEELILQAKEQGYAVVDWNVTAEDSVGGNPSAATIASRVIRGCKEQNTAVVLMHDSSTNKATAEALPTIIRWLQENSYRFDTVDHLQQG